MIRSNSQMRQRDEHNRLRVPRGCHIADDAGLVTGVNTERPARHLRWSCSYRTPIVVASPDGYLALGHLVVQRTVRAGKHRPTQIQVGAQTSQGAALERDIRWLQAHLESTISLAHERAREVCK